MHMTTRWPRRNPASERTIAIQEQAFAPAFFVAAATVPAAARDHRRLAVSFPVPTAQRRLVLHRRNTAILMVDAERLQAMDERPSNALRSYREKRNFDITPEPAEGGVADEAARTFVIQKHWATRLHYDFRLELEGTMKSWAVPK